MDATTPNFFAKYISLLCELNFQTLRNCRGSSCSHFEIQTVMIAYFCKFLQPVCQTHPGGYPPHSVISLLLFYCFVLGCRCYAIIQWTLAATFSYIFSVLNRVQSKEYKKHTFFGYKKMGVLPLPPPGMLFSYMLHICLIYPVIQH